MDKIQNGYKDKTQIFQTLTYEGRRGQQADYGNILPVSGTALILNFAIVGYKLYLIAIS